ncbi:valine--tRNA ligase [bacterium]|nr:valine--tRNA ligase [bacterium]
MQKGVTTAVSEQETVNKQTDITAQLSSKYDPHAVEDRWYKKWEASDIFRADPESDKPAYSIVIPPPNVTGSLHIGHALNNTLQDVLSRRKRMQGYDVLWVPGCDHAGIATQNVVERQLAEEKQNRHDLGREKFIERVWGWKEEYGGTIMRQLRRLGSSLDWSRERFTMDAGLSEAVNEVFVRLYHDGLIYRGDYIINWCPRCHTALSDIETEHQDVDGHFWSIGYPLVEGGETIVVATTRPETLLGDTAVAVHPEDERYRHLIGKRVRLPLMNREIPIIADTYVDKSFGTGAVKITPAHDPNDFWVGERHHLERINVMNEDGTMSAAAGKYAGLDRFACRKQVVKDLKTEQLLVKIEDHAHAVGHCYRCQTVVEPYLSRQWFVKMKPLAEPAMEAVRQGKIRFTPDHWAKNYLEWLGNIRDWCISRQIWWGHRIPAWYCEKCNAIHVAKTGPGKCETCGHGKLRQDSDVLDTWFSSGLWPFSTLGWPNTTRDLKKYYPTSVLVTSWDIIFFWVARMAMLGLKFMGEVPFQEVCINSLVGDAEGKKMSKSKGNTVDPLDIMKHSGADGLRFTMIMIETQSRYVAFTPDRLESSRNFANKIWNAARFVLMNLEEYQIPGLAPQASFVDAWIQSRLDHTIEKVDKALRGYRFAEAGQALYDFIWHEFCDWYLELSKPSLFGKSGNQSAAQYYLYCTLEETLRLLHPFMPFITEEIWFYLPGKQDFIMRSSWPETQPARRNEAVETEMNLLMKVIYAVRNIRGEMNVPPSKKVSLWVRPLEGAGSVLEKHAAIVCDLAKVETLQVDPTMEKPEFSAAAVTEGFELFVPLSGILDPEKEKIRLNKEIQNLDSLLVKLEAKLANSSFVERAPVQVVQGEREKQLEYRQRKNQLEENLKQITV